MKFIEIFEKRDIVLSTMQRLEKYRGQKDVFVHFTKIEKIGVNPRSSYKTPSGVYAYPLEYVLSQNSLYMIPYGTDFENVFVIKAKDKILYLSQYDDLKRDIKKLKNNTLVSWNQKYNIYDIDKIVKHEAKVQTPAGYLWYILYELSAVHLRKTNNETFIAAARPGLWNKLLRYLGYNIVFDDRGDEIIHSNEPVQAIFLTPQSYETLETFKNVIDFRNLEIWAEKNPIQFYNSFMKGKDYNTIFNYFENVLDFNLGTIFSRLGDKSKKLLDYIQQVNPELWKQIGDNIISKLGIFS